MKFGIGLRIVCSLEEGQKEIVDELLKVADQFVWTVNIAVKKKPNQCTSVWSLNLKSLYYKRGIWTSQRMLSE